MHETLIFVYNAESGPFNALADLAHKTFSPETYACNLCALTHSTFGMRREWRAFLDSLPGRKEFLHSDAFRARFALPDLALPAVFARKGSELVLCLSAAQIDACRTMEQLADLLAATLAAPRSGNDAVSPAEDA